MDDAKLMQDIPREYADPDRIHIFKSLIAPGVPNEVVALVYHYASELGLDPLRKEVMAVASNRKDGQSPDGKDIWVKDYNIIVGVHGVLKILGREADYAGLTGAVVYPSETCRIRADGVVEHEYDVAVRADMNMAIEGEVAADPARLLPIGAWATIRRVIHGRERLFTSWVPFSQVAQTTWLDVWKTNDQGKNYKAGKKRVLRSIWAQRPDWMTEKCGIGAVARKAYDHRLGKVYVPEEFGAVSDASGAIIVPEEGRTATPLAVLPEPTEVRFDAGIVTRQAERPAEMVPARTQANLGAPSLFTADAGDSIVDDLVGKARVPADPGEEMPMAEAIHRLEGSVEAAEARFKEPPRKFLVRTGAHVWVHDAEVLERVKSASPILVSKASPARIMQVARAINSISDAKEAAGGR